MKKAILSRRDLIRRAAAATAAALLPGAARALPGPALRRAIPAGGEEIAVLGMGTSRTFTHAVPRRQLGQVLQAFFDQGGQLIDSSPMYGAAESLVGQLLGETENTAGLFAATKVWTDGREAGMRQMKESMRRMGAAPMDLMQIHNLRDWRVHLGTLREWKERGRIRYLGITTSHGRFHEELEDIMKKEPLDFIQLSYNIANRVADERLLPLARDKGIAVIVNRPYQRGELFGKVRGKPLPPWAGDIDCAGWGQFFLKFIIGHPAVTCVIPATTKAAHMLDNMAGGRGRVPGAALRQRMVRYLESL